VHLGPFTIDRGNLPSGANITITNLDYQSGGPQLHTGDEALGTLSVHLDNTAEQNAVYTFTITITAYQFNEYGPPPPPENNPPYIPSGPNPPDGATNVDINADLSWTGGDPDVGDTVTYDVYFGLSSPPSLVISSQSDTSYNPGTMTYETSYYWQVVAWDNHGASAQGPVWSFTTRPETPPENNPPNPPSDPGPEDDATDVDINADLSWTGGDPDVGDTVTYDVYFGTSSPPSSVVSGQSGTSYDPGVMNYNTQYYWKIVAWDNHGEDAEGPVWSFTTEAPPPGNNPPYTPFDPDPFDGAIDVGLNVDLSWSGGDPDPGDTVTYDVYFDTTSPPPLVVSGQSGTTYDPGTMNYETRCYWQIVSWDNHGASTEGPVWSFTTESGPPPPNNPPYTPSNPTPADGATNIEPSSDFVITWDGGDPDAGDLVNYHLHLGIVPDPPFMGTIGSYNHDYTPISFTIEDFITQYDTTYYWKIIAEDDKGLTSTGPVWNFTTRPENFPPNEPSNPSPSNGATGININADLSWTGGDPDVGDTVTYDVYFGTTNPPPKIEPGNQSGTTYDTGTMSYSNKYYWQIIAEDNNGASTDGPIWSFTTEAESRGSRGSPPLPPSPPIADAGGPYEEFFVGYGITFNGSGSTGSITSYEWDFGDGNTGTGEVVTHSYVGDGTYVVDLTVTGPGGSDTNTTYALILSELNNPPTAPEVTGEQDGTKNTDYNYTAMSTDEDNDTIQYIFDWGDGTNTTTDFVANGTAVTEAHNWSTWGVYTSSVNAYDNDTYSGTTDYVVLIDVLYVKNIGYLIDTDSNGTYDSFYSNETLEQTSVEKLANGSYLINSDIDDGWDYIYGPDTDTLTAYSLGEEAEDNTIWYLLIVGLIIAIILLFLIAAAMKKKEKEKEKKKSKK